MKSIRGAVVIILPLCMVLVGCGINLTPATGQKVGQIVKVSQEGLFSKTWEGQLIRGGMTGGSGTAGTPPFDFTIESDELAGKAQEYMQKQTEVVIHYRTAGVYSEFSTENGGTFVTSIELAKSSVPSVPAAQ